MLADVSRPETWSEVRDLPSVFAEYDDELVQLAAGSRGKTGLLRLRFELLGGRTCLVEAFSSGPQVVHRAHYLDNELEDMAVVFIQSVGGGVLQGDRLRTEIIVGEGARALITTQAATKAYKMEANFATQRIDVKVEKNAFCEMILDGLIPYRGVRMYTELDFEVDPTGVLVYQDQVSPGRVALGESFQYELLYSRMRCSRPDGRLIAADTTVLRPQKTDPHRPGIYGTYTELGSMYVIAQQRKDISRFATEVHDCLQGLVGIFGSASVMPSGCGVHARLLGTDNRHVDGALHRCWATARRELLGVGVPNIYTIKHGFGPSTELESETRGGMTWE